MKANQYSHLLGQSVSVIVYRGYSKVEAQATLDHLQFLIDTKEPISGPGINVRGTSAAIKILEDVADSFPKASLLQVTLEGILV